VGKLEARRIHCCRWRHWR